MRDNAEDMFENESNFAEIKAKSLIEKDQNKIDFLLTKVQLNEENMRQLKLLNGYVLPATYAIIDFFDHPPQKTDTFEGLNSEYLFQIQYKVNVTEENDLRIEFYMMTMNNSIKIAESNLSLSGLLNNQLLLLTMNIKC